MDLEDERGGGYGRGVGVMYCICWLLGGEDYVSGSLRE